MSNDAPSSDSVASPAALEPRAVKRLRIWPAVLVVALPWLALKIAEQVAPGTPLYMQLFMWRPLVTTVGILLWWMLASRISWRDRFRGLAIYAVLGGIAYGLMDPTLGGMIFSYIVLPTVSIVAAVAFIVTPFLSWGRRQVVALGLVTLAWAYYTSVRFDGVTGEIAPTLTFRWVPTSEEKYREARIVAAEGGPSLQENAASEPLTLQAGDWPGFRGPDRDGRLTEVAIDVDWKKNPPEQVWRHRVGPGWSSFAVVGDRLFTQEQLDQDELIVCYDANTGAQIWVHKDDARFTESIAGPGPRATPTFHEGKLYVMGATGLLNCLDAATGRPIWTRDIVKDSGASLPTWGFSSSPFVVDGVATVFAGGPDSKSVLGYDVETGEPAWQGGEGKSSYCSMQPARLDGVEQLLMATEQGLAAFQPQGGEVLWNHVWEINGIQRVVQPAILNETDVLLGSPFGEGLRRIHVSQQDGKWDSQEVWTTKDISPYYNDFVVHGDHLYGFDGAFLTCVSLEDGKRQWKARGYGNGQVLLLADQELLLVLSETGTVALVEAKPDKRREVASFQALEGKTWNHPVVAHGKLFVRNGDEAACYQLGLVEPKE
ncbi:MAG: alcohol dehydrogenase [Pirellula sp.]|nr:alcohol dehydrogenase [Pirellula sp.]